MQRLRRILVCALVLSSSLVLAQNQPPPREIKDKEKAHTALVHSLALSPDGKLLASAGFDDVVKVWEFPSGKLLRELKAKDGKDGHTAPVYCVAFNKDGTLLASSSHDKTIRLWNPADGKAIREIKGHGGLVDSITFSPDGKLLASASEDKTVRLWNPADGKEVKNLGSLAKSGYAVAFSPDGKLLAAGGADPVIKVFDVAAGKELKQLKGHGDGGVTALTFTPDNKKLISVSQDQTARVWDVEAGKELKQLGQVVKEKDDKGKEVEKVKPSDDYYMGVVFSRDGKLLATAGYAGWLKLWDLEKGVSTFSQRVGSPKPSPCYCVIVTPDGKGLISGHDNGCIYVTPLGK